MNHYKSLLVAYYEASNNLPVYDSTGNYVCDLEALIRNDALLERITHAELLTAYYRNPTLHQTLNSPIVYIELTEI